MKVLIVGKTHMRQLCCVGGLILDTNRSVRLLKKDGSYHSVTTPIDVGQVWDLQIEDVKSIRPPHTEDVRVLSAEQVGSLNQLRSILLEKGRILPSNPHHLFDGQIEFTSSGSGYIAERNGVPQYSTGYWIPNRPLKKYMDNGKINYRYDMNFKIKYVGFQEPIDVIPEGSLFRLSLARWWQIDPTSEERCYLQLSGWYLD